MSCLPWLNSSVLSALSSADGSAAATRTTADASAATSQPAALPRRITGRRLIQRFAVGGAAIATDDVAVVAHFAAVQDEVAALRDRAVRAALRRRVERAQRGRALLSGREEHQTSGA